VRGLIYAVTAEGVMGLGGKIPWHYPGDLARFKRLTRGSTVIMGRLTFESIGKPLVGRRNLVVTSRALNVPGIECIRSLPQAVALAGDADVWFIGGARIYEEAMTYADRIDVTYVPDHVEASDAVRAPSIDERTFAAGPVLPHEDDPTLSRRLYVRRAP
jgi:dihydrofolate reductase